MTRHAENRLLTAAPNGYDRRVGPIERATHEPVARAATGHGRAPMVTNRAAATRRVLDTVPEIKTPN
ncbi:hypothetical protein Raf01_06620 [Rugosimonospora africana]|uniref:Uncharacterized protein n=1 Tax=Rugosimonospora africana TaxID=556532 RepID=A0A8J3VN04_9ACTN|nr:hypothetical protein Raf01_06620 [Rugosimonospora africana]